MQFQLWLFGRMLLRRDVHVPGVVHRYVPPLTKGRVERRPARILVRAADRFAHPTRHPNELWQTDFTYLQAVGWGWYHLSTVLDDYSRYILAWTLNPNG